MSKNFKMKENVVIEPVKWDDFKKEGLSNFYDMTSDWVTNYETPVETVKHFKDYAQQYQRMMNSLYGDSDEYIFAMKKLGDSCYLGKAYINAIIQCNMGWGTNIPDAKTVFSELKKLLETEIWASMHEYDIDEIFEWKKAIR